MGVKVKNNAFGTISAGISAADTTIVLDTGQGARFPTLGSGDFFFGTLVDTSNNIEVVKVTARSTDSMTVTRAQDNTTARAFVIGDRFELRPTAALFEAIQDEASVDGITSNSTSGTAITIDSSNNTTIEQNLTVDGTADVTGNSQFSGNVGVGVTASQPLHVKKANGGNPVAILHNSQTAAADNGEVLELRTERGTGTTGAVAVLKMLSQAGGTSHDLFAFYSDGDMYSVTTNNGSYVRQMWGARAFVQFDGVGTVAIRTSGNVSSITDSGTGHYAVNLSNAMPSNKFCALVTGTGGQTSSGYAQLDSSSFGGGGDTDDHPSASKFNIRSTNSSGANVDHPIVCAAVIL